MISKVIRFCLENKLVVALAVIVVMAWGVLVAPFDWKWVPRVLDPLAVGAGRRVRVVGVCVGHG